MTPEEDVAEPEPEPEPQAEEELKQGSEVHAPPTILSQVWAALSRLSARTYRKSLGCIFSTVVVLDASWPRCIFSAAFAFARLLGCQRMM